MAKCPFPLRVRQPRATVDNEEATAVSRGHEVDMVGLNWSLQPWLWTAEMGDSKVVLTFHFSSRSYRACELQETEVEN